MSWEWIIAFGAGCAVTLAASTWYRQALAGAAPVYLRPGPAHPGSGTAGIVAAGLPIGGPRRVLTGGAALPGALRFPTVGFRKFPLFLTCVPRAQSKTAPRLWQILLITTSAARMEQVDWARSLAEQCRYAEPDPA